MCSLRAHVPFPRRLHHTLTLLVTRQECNINVQACCRGLVGTYLDLSSANRALGLDASGAARDIIVSGLRGAGW